MFQFLIYFFGLNILALEKLKTKISCYIFKAKIKILLGMNCFQFSRFGKLLWKVCSTTSDCLSNKWENINSCLETFLGLGIGFLGNIPKEPTAVD